MVPLISTTDRLVEELLDDVYCDIWKLSKKERAKLHKFWTKGCKEQFYQAQKDRFRSLTNEHAFLRERERARYDEVSFST